MGTKPHGRPVQATPVLLKARVSDVEGRFIQSVSASLGISKGQFLRALVMQAIFDFTDFNTQEEKRDV